MFSVSLYRHPFVYTLFNTRFTLIVNNKITQVSPSGPVSVSGPGLRLGTNDTTPDRVFLGGPRNDPDGVPD